jgi:hypothetical protein
VNALHDALEQSDFETLKKIQTSMEISKETLWTKPSLILANDSAERCYIASETLLGVLDEDGFIESVDLSFLESSDLPVSMKLSHSNLLFCLLKNGTLVIVCTVTMEIIEVWNEVGSHTRPDLQGFSFTVLSGKCHQFYDPRRQCRRL